MTYTGWAAVSVAVVLVVDLAVPRSQLVLQRQFWISYGIVLFFQLLTNGWLTGRRIVSYSPSAVLGSGTPHLLGGWRVGYAPVEDLLFGFALVLWTLLCWDAVGRRTGSGTDHDRRARR